MNVQRVLVTGGAAGIGRATAERMVEAGHDVIVIDRAPSDPKFSGLWIQADLESEAETAAALEKALAGGPITRLVNNVGIVLPASVEDVTVADLERAVSLNLRCTLQCVQAVLPGMKEAKFGRIVQISSRAALGKELRTAYAATKAGLHGFTRTWALELARYGITVNAVGPGAIKTALFEAANPPDAPRTHAIIAAVPAKRMGAPEEVAHAVAYFLDAEAGFVTGQVLYVCGGLTVGIAE